MIIAVKEILGFSLAILIFLVLFNLLLEPFFEQSMIYFPYREIEEDPEVLGLKYEDVFIKAEDGVTIHGWFIQNKDSGRVVLYFHGNAGNISHRLPVIDLLYRLPASILIIDYHGYGRSQGRPSEKNLYLDAEAAYDYLIAQKKYLPSQIILMGRSIGGVVAADLACRKEVGGVVMEGCFTSAREMARDMLFLFTRPLVWIRSDFNALEKVKVIEAPKLFIHSKEDEMIPYRMSVTLYEKAAGPKKLLLHEKGGHNDFVITPEYVRHLKEIVSIPSPQP